MNDLKKIYIIIDDEKTEKQIDTIIVFSRENSPVIVKKRNNDSKSYLEPLIEILGGKEKGANIINNLHSAIDSGMITRVYSSNKEQVEALQIELLEEELKYGDTKEKEAMQDVSNEPKQVINRSVDTKEKEVSQVVSNESEQTISRSINKGENPEFDLLVEYYRERVELDRLIRLSSTNQLPLEQYRYIESKTNRIKELAAASVYVQALENGREDLKISKANLANVVGDSEDEIARERIKAQIEYNRKVAEYDKTVAEIRAKFYDMYKNLKSSKNTVTRSAEPNVEIMSKEEIDLVKEYLKERLELNKLIRLANNGMLPADRNNDIATMELKIKFLMNSSEMIRELEEARENLKNGVITQEEYNDIYSRNNTKFSNSVKFHSQNNEVIDTPEIRVLRRYLTDRKRLDRLNELAEKRVLPPVGTRERSDLIVNIKSLVESNANVRELEEARENLKNGIISQEEYDEIYNRKTEEILSKGNVDVSIEPIVDSEQDKLQIDSEIVDGDFVFDDDVNDIDLGHPNEKTIDSVINENESLTDSKQTFENDDPVIIPVPSPIEEGNNVIEINFPTEEYEDPTISTANNSNVGVTRRERVNVYDDPNRRNIPSREYIYPTASRRTNGNTVSNVNTTGTQNINSNSKQTFENNAPVIIPVPSSIEEGNNVMEINFPTEEYEDPTISTANNSNADVTRRERVNVYDDPNRRNIPSREYIYPTASRRTNGNTVSNVNTTGTQNINSNRTRNANTPNAQSVNSNRATNVGTPANQNTSTATVSSPSNCRVNGKVNVVPEHVQKVNTPSGTVKVKKTSKLKKFFKAVGAVIIGAISSLGIGALVRNFIENRKNKNKVKVVVDEDKVDTNRVLINNINDYCLELNVPDDVKNFLLSNRAVKFLSQYSNEDQLKEVLSALCDGYSNGFLTRESGNFRRDEDGDNFLRVYVNDFLCAKVIVNGYSPEQMLAVFGNSQITPEQIMDGYRSYYLTLYTYGTDAIKPWNFKYLTNNDPNATKMLEGLFDKLVTVNINRRNGTLTSEHTDDFIAEVYRIFVQNDSSLRQNDGAKDLAAAMVSSFVKMQAQVAYGEALYLHEDHGLAKAGVNLQAVDGRFTIISQDKTSYEFTNLLDIVNHDFVDPNQIGFDECLAQYQLLNDNINVMNTLTNGSMIQSNLTLANILYQNGLNEYGGQVSRMMGVVPQSLLNEIENAHPSLADEIDAYEQSVRTSNKEYVPFDVTVDGAHKLFASLFKDNEYLKEDRSNDYVSLINLRYHSAFGSKYEVTSGKRYVSSSSYSYDYVPSGRTPTVVTTTTTEEVSYEDLTPAEQETVNNLIEEEQQQETIQNQTQIEEAEEVGQNIINSAQEGTITQEQAEQMAEDVGMILDPNLVENVQNMYEGQDVTEQVDAQLAQQNAQEQQTAQENNAAQEAANDQNVDDLNALIQQGAYLENSSSGSSPDIDYSDPGLIEETSSSVQDEVPVVVEESVTEDADVIVVPDIDFASTELYEDIQIEPAQSSHKEELQQMKAAALAAVDVDDLGLDVSTTNEKTPSKTLSFTRNV